MPEATLRLDYIPFKVTMKDTEWQQLKFINRLFFITFHVYEKRKKHNSDCGDIIAEDNKWVSSLMRSFDTTKTRSSHERNLKLLWHLIFSIISSFDLKWKIEITEEFDWRLNECAPLKQQR